ncbi:MAG: hypothetical protein A3H97_18685 [Acidobacteria bacterium RIFCSPLOWO2_02_FULL_65_29]|nr:MAG: hypothetical protein A3H97_18685 [Acidobacteria bacterium RIFCSPLOWO2_02_FULL_65_29]
MGAVAAASSSATLSASARIAAPVIAQASTSARQTSAVPFDRAFLDRYCVSCHNEKLKAAGKASANLALDEKGLDQIGEHAEVWEKVVLKLRSREMPPPGSRRPDEAAYAGAVRSLETALDGAAAARGNAGRIAVHRLNRSEYANAVRDLLALEIDAPTLLSPDETGYGFDNIADVLTISPGLLDRYKLAAWKISRLAVGDPTIRPSVETYKVSRFIDQDYRVSEDLPFGSRGGSVIHHNFPLDGEYVLRIGLQRAYAANVIKGLSQREEIDVRLNGERLKLFAIGGECVGSEEARCKEFRPNINVASGVRVLPAEYDLYADKELEVRFPAKAGPATLLVSFVDKSAVATEGGGQARKPLGVWQTDNASGIMSVDNVQIEGPFDARVPEETASRRRVFVCRPAARQDEGVCAKRILSTLARRAYRRPVTGKDVDALLRFYENGRGKGGFDRGIQFAIEAVLMSPNFLLRVENVPARSTPGSAYQIDDLDLASRLSFFLWSSLPDEELLDVAAAGKLKNARVLEQQVRRMLADPKSRALVDGFFTQWLSLRDLQNVAPDPALYPDFEENLRNAFLEETLLFIESQLNEDHGATELLTANYTFLNERLAKFYDVPHVYGARFRRVELTDPNRAGLLGHASILTVTSYSTRTSPVVRGKWLLTNILGSPPPAPPPNVPALVENGEAGAAPSSVRDRMAQHRSSAICASCHRRIDPMGFALENFSAIGRWRTTEFGLPIDPTGAFPDGTEFATPAEFRKALLKQSSEFVRTLTTKLLTYAVGRGATYQDMPAVRAIMREAASSDHRWSALILAVVRSAPFQMNRAPEPESARDRVASAR